MAKNTKNKSKSTYEREDIIEMMVCDILNGVSRFRVMKKLEKNAYEDVETASFSRAKKYSLLQEAYERCTVPLEEEREKLRNLQIARLEDILEECREQRDRANAVNTIKEINKLTGIYPTENVTVSGDGKISVNISFGLEHED